MGELASEVQRIQSLFHGRAKRGRMVPLTDEECDFILNKMKFVATIDDGYGERDQETLDRIRAKLSR